METTIGYIEHDNIVGSICCLFNGISTFSGYLMPRLGFEFTRIDIEVWHFSNYLTRLLPYLIDY